MKSRISGRVAGCERDCDGDGWRLVVRLAHADVDHTLQQFPGLFDLDASLFAIRHGLLEAPPA